MKRNERLRIILKKLENYDNLTMKKYFEITKNIGTVDITARRDLNYLEDLGYIEVSFGAIKILNSDFETTRNEKINLNKIEKHDIGVKAGMFLNKNDEIYVSPSTTMEEFVKNIEIDINTLYTNGLDVFKNSKNNKHIKHSVLIGGKFREPSDAFAGDDTLNTLKFHRYTKGFFTITNIDEDFTMFNNNDEEAEIFRTALKQTDESFLLIDSTKFESTGNSLIEKIDNINNIITDSNLSIGMNNKLTNLFPNLKIIIAD